MIKTSETKKYIKAIKHLITTNAPQDDILYFVDKLEHELTTSENNEDITDTWFPEDGVSTEQIAETMDATDNGHYTKTVDGEMAIPHGLFFNDTV